MLKWIGGCFVVGLVIVCVVLFIGYRKLKTFAEAGPTASVTINAPSARVFANMANADSLAEWRMEGLGIRAARKGMLRVGDTLHVQEQRSAGDSERRQRTTWVVSAITPGKLIAIDIVSDTGQKVMATRRDSLVSAGDSTTVFSSFASPMLDSVRTSRADSGKAPSGMLDMTTKLLVSTMRMASSIELTRLKKRLEGDTLTPPPATKQ